jgi:hypothetical protein
VVSTFAVQISLLRSALGPHILNLLEAFSCGLVCFEARSNSRLFRKFLLLIAVFDRDILAIPMHSARPSRPPWPPKSAMPRLSLSLSAKTCDCAWGVLRSTPTAVSMHEKSEALGVGRWVWVDGLFLVVGLVGELDSIGRAANHNAHQSFAFVSQLLACRAGTTGTHARVIDVVETITISIKKQLCDVDSYI